jgi:predicted DNA-binding antitoxin AbrB/MazE fold protein
MKPVHAIYERGIFRPTEPVDFPEGSRVVVGPDPATQLPPVVDEGLDEVYAILSRRYSDGESYDAARHDEHQP